jgi:hypothetical protein
VAHATCWVQALPLLPLLAGFPAHSGQGATDTQAAAGAQRVAAAGGPSR